jgi:hypothetical protein
VTAVTYSLSAPKGNFKQVDHELIDLHVLHVLRVGGQLAAMESKDPHWKGQSRVLKVCHWCAKKQQPGSKPFQACAQCKEVSTSSSRLPVQVDVRLPTGHILCAEQCR